jgi:PAS domain S-box-containing protein
MFRNRSLIIGIGISLIVATIVLGQLYLNGVKMRLMDSVQHGMSSITKNKINDISNWYAGQIKLVEIISRNNNLIHTIEQFQKSGKLEDFGLMDEVIKTEMLHDGFEEIIILSLDDEIFYSSNSELVLPDKELVLGAHEAMNDRKVYPVDLYWSEQEDRILLSFIATIRLHDDTPLANVVFQIDPNKDLFPLISNWPMPNKSAEVLIVRQEGDQVYFFNEFWNRKDDKYRLSVPLVRLDIPAVQVVSGAQGIFQGLDYDEVEVVSYIDCIPNTPWSLVAKIDKKELYEPIYRESINIFLIFFLFSLLILLFFGYLYQTVQRNSFKSLWQAQEEFRTTLYSIGDAVITTDVNGIIKHFNPVAEALTGWTENEVFLKSIDEVFHIVSEEGHETIINPIHKVVTEGVIVGLTNHTLLISKHGGEIPISESAAPILNKEGEITGAVLVFRDQSVEREHQLVVEEQERQLSTLMSNLPGMAYRCHNDKDWTIEFVSKGCLELTGYTDKELHEGHTKTYNDLIFTDDREKVKVEVQKALGLKKRFQLEYRIQKKNKEIVWVWERGQGVYDGNGNLIVIEGFINDINQRKQFESELKKSEHLFYTLANNSSVGIFKTDSRGLTTYVNPKWCELSGVSALNAMNDSWLDCVHPSDVELLKSNWEKDVANQCVSDAEYRFIRKNGDIVWVKGQAVPELNEHNEVVGYIGTITDITDLNFLMTALREREEGFDIAQQMAKVGSWEINYVQGVEAWSKQMFKHFELPVASSPPLLDQILQLIHPEDRNRVRDELSCIQRGTCVNSLEFRSNPDLLRLKYFILSFKSCENEEGEVVKSTGTLVDITEREEFESKLVESNYLLRTIVDVIPDQVYLKNLNGQKLIANKADQSYMGVSEIDNLLEKTDFDFYPEEIARRLLKDDLEVIRTGIPILDKEEKLINYKGHERWILTSKIPYRNHNGEIVGLVGLGHDITQRKKGNDERLKLSTALAQSPVSIIVTNPSAEIEYVNPKFTEVTGYTLDEVLGKNPRFLKSETQSDLFYSSMWGELLSGNEWRSEFHNKKKNGQLFWENVIIAPIRNNNDELINYVAVKEDITDKKQMIEDLIAATNKAVESDKLKTSFLANMSHEIRTPLNSILGFTDILNESYDLTNEERDGFSHIIKKSADSLLQIINDILDISSLETHQLKISRSEFNANDVVTALYLEYIKKLEEGNLKDIQIKKVISKSDVIMTADKNRLNQIFINLISNSLKFTEKGTIEFGVEKVTPQEIFFYVEDTGIGIKKEMLSVVFERFRQGEDSTTRIFGGNGLGLSIVKNLVEVMGGKINVESVLGEGTVFRFHLPR